MKPGARCTLGKVLAVSYSPQPTGNCTDCSQCRSQMWDAAPAHKGAGAHLGLCREWDTALSCASECSRPFS